ncbi:MAG: DUF4152 family protein [Candidatus Bathyarchaeia archaeon]
MKIVAADSSSAILNDKFEPLTIVAAAAVLVNPPYREPNLCLAKPIFIKAEDGHEAVIREAELCKELLGRVKADVVHLDMSLGAVSLEELSPIQFSNMKVSSRARQHLLRILPKLRKISGEITQKYRIEVLAIGKESIPVRIAELTSGAHAIIYTSEKVIEEKKALMLGLPSKCQPRLAEKGVYLYSLIGAEHDVRGYAEDKKEILKKVNIIEMLNPTARGFRVLKITPKV